MAYFSNGTDGMVFSEQCSMCKYGQEPCPIAWVQLEYNYKACNNEVASAVLNDLIKNDGTCEMFKAFRTDFETEESVDRRTGQLRMSDAEKA